VQERGFNAFSYADIAAELGVTPASLHYHFPGKAELGRALIERYSARFADALEAIAEHESSADAMLRAYAELHLEVLRGGKLCLCGMLAADYPTLPPAMQEAVRAFFDMNRRWVAGVLERGRLDGSFRYAAAPDEVARALVGSLQGAMLITRPDGNPSALEGAAATMIAALTGQP
jgi:TetR/AcrR family transcriptional repressor of nem operon